jgi:undecaprenyl-diphosphatase
MAQLILLGLVQGLTEFLPVSSTTHLLFAEHFLRLPRPGLVLEAVLHLGTALAVLMLFWPDVRRLIAAVIRWMRHTRMRGAPGDRPVDDPDSRLAGVVLLATVVTAALGLLFLEPLERMFTSVRGAAVQLLANGLILLLARERGLRRAEDAGALDGLVLGLAQAVSIVPGISRSGITIAAALWRGLGREDAARLSFLVALPALVGASLFALRDLGEAASLGYTPAQLATGFVVSALSGAAAIRWLLAVLRRSRLGGFALYCWAAGLAVLVATR